MSEDKGTQIPVAEQFYSLQGEGPEAGSPALFLRLAGCNLSCGLTQSDVEDFEKGQEPEEGAEWICDTIDVWREADQTYSAEELLNLWEERGWLEALRNGVHLVITGGEPLLPGNQRAISVLAENLALRHCEPFVEVETNGSIRPESKLWSFVDQWNVSMKLANSGMDEEDRINDEAIRYFKSVHKEQNRGNATFKFVASGEEDAQEIVDLAIREDIPKSMITLMPAGQTQEQLRETYPKVAQICKRREWDFSPRLQIDIWGEVTGV